MAGTSLLALIDDIASTLDDIAVLTKVAAKKTAGVLGDDLALNAQQVSGVNADRELPVVYAVFKGSGINKIILIPLALSISYFAPWAVIPLLMLGGLYLCFEGFEKVFEKLFHRAHSIQEFIHDPKDSMENFEAKKVKGAVRTDFILSAEIIVISLGTVADAPLAKQFMVLVSTSIIMTFGVYGLVALIVKLDDLGLLLTRQNQNAFSRWLGRRLLEFAPKLMKSLGVVGTLAMFLVGGGILVHGIPAVHHLAQSTNGFEMGVNLIFGIFAGGMALLGLTSFRWVKSYF